MTVTAVVVNSAIKRLSRVLCRVHDAQLKQVPKCGPLILVPNHINFLDAPVLYTHLRPRDVTALAKVETWDNPALRFLFNMAGAIPLRRGEADVQALRRGLEALKEGRILAVAPEGHRSGHGRLQKGHTGVVLMALWSGAPLLPLASYGIEKFRSNVTRLRRTDYHIVVGNLFYLDAHGQKVTREVRRRMADEIMYQLAALLPSDYRGQYSDLSKAGMEYLRFPIDSESNLCRADGFVGRA
jgi:1-acyl-sn-glycerol-3-phosphate acyltransferase